MSMNEQITPNVTSSEYHSGPFEEHGRKVDQAAAEMRREIDELTSDCHHFRLIVADQGGVIAELRSRCTLAEQREAATILESQTRESLLTAENMELKRQNTVLLTRVEMSADDMESKVRSMRAEVQSVRVMPPVVDMTKLHNDIVERAG